MEEQAWLEAGQPLKPGWARTVEIDGEEDGDDETHKDVFFKVGDGSPGCSEAAWVSPLPSSSPIT